MRRGTMVAAALAIAASIPDSGGGSSRGAFGGTMSDEDRRKRDELRAARAPKALAKAAAKRERKARSRLQREARND